MEALLPQLLSYPPQPPPQKPLTEAQCDVQIRAITNTLNHTTARVLTGGVGGENDLLDVLDPSVNSLPYLYGLLAHANTVPSRIGKEFGLSGIKYPNLELGGPLWQRVVTFLECFDAGQMRCVGHEWRKLVELVVASARNGGKPLVAVRPVCNAIIRLDPTGSILTSSHVAFVSLCLEARTFRAALPVIDLDIWGFPSPNSASSSLDPQKHPMIHRTTSMANKPETARKRTAITSKPPVITNVSGFSTKLAYTDHLLYHLYGAMIYIGLKKWKRALEFLRYVITAPAAGAISKIMVEAYKKWILVSLIYQGSPPESPRNVRGHNIAYYHALVRAYENLGSVFKRGDYNALIQEIQAGQSLWEDDSNYGLVMLIPDALTRFAVRKIGGSYSTMSIHQICQRQLVPYRPTPQMTGKRAATTSSSSTSTAANDMEHGIEQRLLLSMIASGELEATLFHHPETSPTAILHFSNWSEFNPDPSLMHSSSSRATAKKMTSIDSEYNLMNSVQARMNRIMELGEHIRQFDQRISLSRDFISWSQRTSRAGRDLDHTFGSSRDGGGGGAISVNSTTNTINATTTATSVGIDDESVMDLWGGGGSGGGSSLLYHPLVSNNHAPSSSSPMATFMPDEDVMADF